MRQRSFALLVMLCFFSSLSVFAVHTAWSVEHNKAIQIYFHENDKNNFFSMVDITRYSDTTFNIEIFVRDKGKGFSWSYGNECSQNGANFTCTGGILKSSTHEETPIDSLVGTITYDDIVITGNYPGNNDDVRSAF